MNGIEEVRAWGARQDSTGRTTSHLTTNFLFSIDSEDRVEVDSSALNFVHTGDGIGPAKPWPLPSTVTSLFISMEIGRSIRGPQKIYLCLMTIE
jgi:hypothetical protein